MAGHDRPDAGGAARLAWPARDAGRDPDLSRRARTRSRRLRGGARHGAGGACRGGAPVRRTGRNDMTRPLVITDCDEVPMHMVVPFAQWVDAEHGVLFRMEAASFACALKRK